MKTKLMALVEDPVIKKDVTPFEIGDTVDVHQRILEGQKERLQVYNGVVISRRGQGLQEMFTVRRIVQGEGVERTFALHSPKIAKVEVKRTGTVRRAKLYYLRDRIGKATRLRERKAKGPEATATAAARREAAASKKEASNLKKEAALTKKAEAKSKKVKES